ncbi:hypothetical protein Q5H93_06870 [Hymenobacter sp. ASUV-10]|uniref:Quercetin 2,3-dioxygenase C-terminal cupin domain-containing protein n=1 Tax=Hymenobacter aranciens TaxID=3063996 RepID=A0ABT9B9W0_9BACT|nr:hypothetical protein [Hymenobacter sp. ASUV-10]MDO7874448.1 hypothetical protein [Hymenobacter sp. ASUV-10]
MSLPPPAVYNSLFLKADYRTVITTDGSHTYRSSVAQQARLDDIFLLPGASLRPDTAGPGGQLLLLPIVGGALLSTAHEHERPLLPGCLYALPEADADRLTLTNPFEETVNVLLIRAPVPAAATPAPCEFELPLTAKNTLVQPVGQALPVQVGLYDSRVKGHLAAPAPGEGFGLCYVLNGAFEIEDRLAEHRDALVLWDTPRIGFEALSETAILLYLQFAKA